ncbi:MAG: TRL-like family protein [Desulfosarcina sp.]|nr:TRL-like family protein [Desulfobacterales bacterium]
MQKKLTIFLVIFFMAFALSGCAVVKAPVSNGLIFTAVSGPETVTANIGYSKVGRASCRSILGIVSTGDASINAAMKNGGISKIHHVDYESMSVLGVFAKFTTIVYGE